MGFKLHSDFPKQFQLVRFPRPRLGGYSQRFAVQRQDVVSVDEVLQRFIRRCQLFRHSIYKICVVRVFLWCVCDKKKRDLFQSNNKKASEGKLCCYANTSLCSIATKAKKEGKAPVYKKLSAKPLSYWPLTPTGDGSPLTGELTQYCCEACYSKLHYGCIYHHKKECQGGKQYLYLYEDDGKSKKLKRWERTVPRGTHKGAPCCDACYAFYFPNETNNNDINTNVMME